MLLVPARNTSCQTAVWKRQGFRKVQDRQLKLVRDGGPECVRLLYPKVSTGLLCKASLLGGRPSRVNCLSLEALFREAGVLEPGQLASSQLRNKLLVGAML